MLMGAVHPGQVLKDELDGLGSKLNQVIDNGTAAARVWSLVGDGRCMCLKALA